MNDWERGLTEIGGITWVHAIFEIDDTKIKVDGGKAMMFSTDDGSVQSSDKLVQGAKKEALATR